MMKNFWTQSEKNVYVAAHRGFSEKYPENTMPAFRAAIELGVDQIETDVRITKDGELVLIHDAYVDRTSNGKGVVHDMTYAELLELDFGSWKGEEFKGEKVVTLREFMELVKDLPDITLDLELKEYPYPGWEEVSYSVADRVLEMVDEYGFTDRIVINSFSGKLNERIYEKYGKKYRQHVFYPISSLIHEMKLNPYYYAYCACMFTDEKNDYIYMKNSGVRCWGGASIKNAETLDAAIERGVELVTVNNPDVILTLLRERGLHK